MNPMWHPTRVILVPTMTAALHSPQSLIGCNMNEKRRESMGSASHVVCIE